MSKYDALGKHLAAGSETTWRATFAQIEAVLGFPLPRSAYAYPAWWSNDATGHSHSRAWLEAGWKTQGVDLHNQQVTFLKEQGTPQIRARHGRARSLHGALKGVVQMVAGTEPFYSRALMLGWGAGGSAGEDGTYLWGRGRWQVLALAPPSGARAIGLEVLPYVWTLKRQAQRLTLGMGRQAETFELRPGWQEVEYPVPLTDERPWRLVFRVEETGRPSELESGSNDRRMLAVGLRRLRWID